MFSLLNTIAVAVEALHDVEYPAGVQSGWSRGANGPQITSLRFAVLCYFLALLLT